MTFSSIDFPKELVYRIFFFLREEDLALAGMTCKIFWESVEKDPYWDSSLKEKIIFPVQSSAKGQLATLYRRYCRYFERESPPSSEENNVFVQKANTDAVIRKVAKKELRSIFENVAGIYPELLPLLIQVSPLTHIEGWRSFALMLTLRQIPSHSNFYIHLLTKPPHELALRSAVQYSASHVPQLLEKGALPNGATLDCAVEHCSALVPLFLAKGANPNKTILCNTARFCPEHIPLVVEHLHKLNIPQETIDEAIHEGSRLRTVDFLSRAMNSRH